MSDIPATDTRSKKQDNLPTSIGGQLCAARKTRKLKIEKVAQALHLDVAVIKALENDEQDKLPAPIFVQGYLKSYGRLVGLPVEKLIREYSEQMGEPPPLSVIRTKERLPAVSQRSIRLIRNVIILLLVVILVWLAYPFLERYIGSQRETAGEQVPGHLVLPPVSGVNGNKGVETGVDQQDGFAGAVQESATLRSIRYL